MILTSDDTVSAAAECRARYSLCQHRQSKIKSLSCTKLLIDFGLSSPAPLPLPSLHESRFENVCCIRHDTDNKNKEQFPIKRSCDVVTINEINFITKRFQRSSVERRCVKRRTDRRMHLHLLNFAPTQKRFTIDRSHRQNVNSSRPAYCANANAMPIECNREKETTNRKHIEKHFEKVVLLVLLRHFATLLNTVTNRRSFWTSQVFKYFVALAYFMHYVPQLMNGQIKKTTEKYVLNLITIIIMGIVIKWQLL